MYLELPAGGGLEGGKRYSGVFFIGYEIFGKEIALGNGYSRDGRQGAEHRRRAVRRATDFQALIESGYLEGQPLEQIQGSWEASVTRFGQPDAGTSSGTKNGGQDRQEHILRSIFSRVRCVDCRKRSSRQLGAICKSRLTSPYLCKPTYWPPWNPSRISQEGLLGH